jgi:hypothetical protein
MHLLTLYPIIFCWISIYGFFREMASRDLISRNWRVGWLLACITWGALLVAIVELTSFARMIVRSVFATTWLITSIIFLATSLWLWKKRTKQPISGLMVLYKQQLFNVDKYIPARLNLPFSHLLLVWGGGFITLALLLVAFSSAPNNSDSMTYHLPRIMHWLQNGRVAHFPTATLRQISFNPWSEFAMMTIYLLSDSDLYVAGVQWFSMLSSLIGVSFIAFQLSKHSLAPTLASLFALSIPMGVMQATSTQNDYVVAFWLVCLLSLCLLLFEDPAKATAYIFALPFVFWLVASLLKRLTLRVVAIHYLLPLTIIVLLLNAGHMGRNFALFQSPLGSDTSVYANQIFGPGPTASNIIRNISLHTATGNEALTGAINGLLFLLHATTGQDINDPRTTFPWATFNFRRENIPHEDGVQNPIHLLGIIVAAVHCLRPSYIRLHKKQAIYGLCLIAAFTIFCAYLRWQPWHSRLHLPLFVLWAPLVSVMLTENLPRRPLVVIGLFLILYAGYWMASNISRPLSSSEYWHLPRVQQYFQNRPDLYEDYERLAETVVSTNCRSIGLITKGGSWEYPVWALLKERAYESRIEHLYVANESAAILNQPFEPCLLVTIDMSFSSVAERLSVEEVKRLTTQFPVEQHFGSTLSLRGSMKLLFRMHQAGPENHPLVTVDPSLAGAVGIDPHLQTPWPIEVYEDHSLSFLWLGHGEAEGLAGTLWSNAAQQVVLEIEVSPGPSREDQQRTVQLVIQSNGQITTQRETFDGGPVVLAFPVQLQPGCNDFQFTVLDEATIPVHGDTRPLLVFLRHITVKPLPGP